LPLWWSAIDAALLPGTQSRLRIFFDSNQRVYKSIGRLPEDVQLVPIRLTQNLRNTQRIHEVVLPQYEGFPIVAIGPEGVAVDLIVVETPKDVRQKLNQIVTRLTNDSIMPEHIAVLVETEEDVRDVATKGKLGNFVAVNSSSTRHGAVTVDTIRNFKGLENRVAIVVCTPRMLTERELPYVGFSRARVNLILLGSEKTFGGLKKTTQ
jgi:DNA helicase IV